MHRSLASYDLLAEKYFQAHAADALTADEVLSGSSLMHAILAGLMVLSAKRALHSRRRPER
jgi:hypothetical protein